ncbi:MAG: N-acetylmuramoyl-L-alanine amidase [Gammaproteobacteria bacterium]|nr:N-acetylmuramoyl-L-alanine amidase [Gammaproteobacteria bacterium]
MRHQSLLRLTCITVLGALISLTAAMAAVVKQVRHSDTQERTRLVLDLDGPVEHSLIKLTNPERIAVQLHGARNAAGQLRLENDSRLYEASLDDRDSTVNLILQTRAAANIKTLLVPPNATQGYRLVVDVMGQGAAQTAPLNKPTIVEATAPAVKPPQVVVSPTPKPMPELRAMPKRKVVIAIDAGHGGKDPGAIGPAGTYEKDVVLSIARRLAATLAKEPELKPVLIRSDDTYLPLRGRIARAQAFNADMFISIHADAVDRDGPNGASVYTLSNKGASSEYAKLLAARENKAGGVDTLGLIDKADPLAPVLLDMVQNQSIESGNDLAVHMLTQMQKVVRLHKRQVQRAGFAVLKSPQIPSILIETGFISNPEEERRLLTADHQSRLAISIRNGIMSYLAANPPQGTLFASR